MNPTRSLFWSRWKTFARRAAQGQSAVLLWLLYYLLLVPIALARRLGRRRRHPGEPAPAWQAKTTHTADLPSARRQF
jgi:hypothetical protein